MTTGQIASPAVSSLITLGLCHTFPWFKKKKSAFLTVPFNRLSSKISYQDYSKFSADEIFLFLDVDQL